jgi:hypothetical protein
MTRLQKSKHRLVRGKLFIDDAPLFWSCMPFCAIDENLTSVLHCPGQAQQEAHEHIAHEEKR